MNEVTKLFGICCLLAAVVVITDRLPHHFDMGKEVACINACKIPGDEFPSELLGDFTFTHYAPTGNRTATQSIPHIEKTIAVDPKVIPLHSIVYIETLGYFVAEDTGSAIKGNKIDIFVSSKEEAKRLGTLQGKKLKVWLMTQRGEQNEVQKETSGN